MRSWIRDEKIEVLFLSKLSLIEGESTNYSGWETKLMEFTRRDFNPI